MNCEQAFRRNIYWSSMLQMSLIPQAIYYFNTQLLWRYELDWVHKMDDIDDKSALRA